MKGQKPVQGNDGVYGKRELVPEMQRQGVSTSLGRVKHTGIKVRIPTELLRHGCGVR